MQRVENWPTCLNRFIDKSRDLTFQWGKTDCALWVCDAVKEITGRDLATGYRDHYKSKSGAARFMKRMAGGGLLEVAEKFTREAGVEPIPVDLAQRGDVVIFDGPLGDTLGICLGRMIAATGPEGLTFCPARLAMKAWRI